jgi:hypothetical protein
VIEQETMAASSSIFSAVYHSFHADEAAEVPNSTLTRKCMADRNDRPSVIMCEDNKTNDGVGLFVPRAREKFGFTEFLAGDAGRAEETPCLPSANFS